MSKNHKILFCNDDDVLTTCIELALLKRNKNIEIIPAKNIKDAKNLYKNQKFDLIVSDIDHGSERGQGYKLLKWVREQNKKIKYVMYSAYYWKTERPKALKLGANFYFDVMTMQDDFLKYLSNSCELC